MGEAGIERDAFLVEIGVGAPRMSCMLETRRREQLCGSALRRDTSGRPLLVLLGPWLPAPCSAVATPAKRGSGQCRETTWTGTYVRPCS